MICFLLSEAKKTGVIVNLKVIPAQARFEVQGWDEGLNVLKIKTKAPPEKGKANQEIEKELSKFFRSPVTLVSGFKNKKKKAFFEGKSLEEVLARART